MYRMYYLFNDGLKIVIFFWRVPFGTVHRIITIFISCHTANNCYIDIIYSLYYIVQCFEIMLIKQLSISYCSNFFYNCQGVVAKQVIL